MNEIIVQKYGGSSVADTEKIMNIARRIKSNVRKKNKVIVVVSAMGKTTDGLIKLAEEITDSPS
ncbi:MAG: aspartate kinase, partial [Spirochaetes bacterium]|nr:aspartate kinase [Spirochaetota bacterium]